MNNKIIEELNYKIDNQEKIIRELQEENKQLKGVIETLKETNKLLLQQKGQLQEDLDMLDKRIDKAIEYIEKYLHHVIDEYPDPEWKFVNEDGMPKEEAKKELLEILKGESNK